MEISENILGVIGRTPMVKINRLSPNKDVNIYAKLEGFNPSGSIKDRIALRMIREAIETGALQPGQTIIEATSGNSGIGLAMAGVVLGYPVEIVMSESVSVERRIIIRSYGAKVTLTRKRGDGWRDPQGTCACQRESGQVLYAGPIFEPGQLSCPLRTDGA